MRVIEEPSGLASSGVPQRLCAIGGRGSAESGSVFVGCCVLECSDIVLRYLFYSCATSVTVVSPAPPGHPHTQKKGGCMAHTTPHTPHTYSIHTKVGSDLLSHTLPGAVPSAQAGLASGFGKGPGVTPPQ